MKAVAEVVLVMGGMGGIAALLAVAEARSGQTAGSQSAGSPAGTTRTVTAAEHVARNVRAIRGEAARGLRGHTAGAGRRRCWGGGSAARAASVDTGSRRASGGWSGWRGARREAAAGAQVRRPVA